MTEQTDSHGQTSKFRMAIMMLITVYPLVTCILYVIMPLTQGWTIWQRSLVLVPVMVGCIVYGVVPAVYRFCGDFVMPKPKD